MQTRSLPPVWTLWLLALGVLILSLAAIPMLASAQEPPPGETTFTTYCVACHTVGGGDLVGPDLAGVTTRRDKDWLTRWIKAPDKVLAEGDPTATQLYEQYNKIPMPNFGLSDTDVAALIAYLASMDAGSTAAPVAAPEPLPAGDAARGKALFLGATQLENGGPACMVCHSVSGIGALGGGALGTDLTDIHQRYGGDAGLAAFLGSPATTTMNAIWSSQPMTDQERADLVAFLGSTSVAVRPTSALWTLAALASLSAVALIALAGIWWRKRLRGVRKPMVAQATGKN